MGGTIGTAPSPAQSRIIGVFNTPNTFTTAELIATFTFVPKLNSIYRLTLYVTKETSTDTLQLTTLATNLGTIVNQVALDTLKAGAVIVVVTLMPNGDNSVVTAQWRRDGTTLSLASSTQAWTTATSLAVTLAISTGIGSATAERIVLEEVNSIV